MFEFEKVQREHNGFITSLVSAVENGYQTLVLPELEHWIAWLTPLQKG